MTQNERLTTMHPVKQLTSRIPKRIAAVGIVATLGLLTVAAYAMFVSLPGHVKVAPVAIVVHSASTLPVEVQALETQTAALLFDRDTTTAHVAYADQSIDAQLEKQTEIKSINIYGPAPYELTVQAQQGSTWSTIAGLDKIKLTSQPAAWNSFQATQSVTSGALRFVLSIPSGNSGGGNNGGGNGKANGNSNSTPSTTVGGIPEIEIWATGEHALVNGTTLVAAMPSGTTTQAKPAQARTYTATPVSAVIGKDGQTFRFTLDRPTNRFKRAWLSYEAYGLSHWVSPVRRINGLSMQGGSFTFSGTDWTPLTEPIHPDWLVTGSNRVDFTLPANMAGNYSVRNVRVITELDDGNNFIARATTITGATTKQAGTEIDAPVLNDGDLTTGWSPYVDPRNKTGQPTLTLTFDKPTQLDSLSLNLVNALSGTMSVDLLVGGQWQSAGLPTINGKKLTAGWNNLNGFAQVPADALRISFLNGSGSPGEIREIAASGSGTGTAYVPSINVAYPDAGQFYGREAYIRGFLSVPDNGSGPAAVAIAGKSIATADGSFGLVVSKEDAGYASQADAEPWQVEVAAIYPDGQKLTQIVKLNQAFDAAKAHGLLPNAVNPLLLVLGDASLEIAPDATEDGVKIKITPLSEKDLPRLDPGMTNVTRGPHKGYRFTPSPYKFKKNIKVTLPFDNAFVPQGHVENDIKTYYFDTQAGHWVPLDRVLVDGSKKRITSLTNHFTDMINATLTVPDHPEAVSFNPTQIKDIKAADPGAGINLIEPPQANNNGDARLSYPIEIPQGRQGMQPQLAISYNSAGGNGWLGMGWDLSVPSISIETRWGVPRYDTAKETETYLLNGEQLTPMAHRGDLKDRTEDTENYNGETVKIFHTRVEGAFRKIIRHGTEPANYWWEVIDKNGTKNYYGGTGTAQDASTILTALTPLGAVKGVFKWALKETVDNNGNSVSYVYERVTSHVIPGGTTTGEQLYIQTINYTGHNGTPGAYTVSFTRETGRPDISTDARGGFKQVTADRLKTIEVKYQTQTVRSYVLTYIIGAFEKSLLTSIAQKGTNGVQFNEHRFDYYDDIRNADATPSTEATYRGFRTASPVSTGNDDYKAQLIAGDINYTVLGGSKGNTTGFEGYGGVGFPVGTKNLHVGLGASSSRSRSKGSSAFVDVDGDGLPDKVFESGYRRNTSPTGSLDNLSFDTSQVYPASGFSNVSESESTSHNISPQLLVFGLAINSGAGITSTNDKSYLSDVNGDGLVDIVKGGAVMFNTAKSSGQAGFGANSFDTESPIGNVGGAIDSRTIPNMDDAKARMEAENPLMDNVRRWVAPYNGSVRIASTVQLVDVANDKTGRFSEEERQERKDYGYADGVRLAIQKNDTERWAARIQADDFKTYSLDEIQNIAANPQGLNAIQVSKGDVILFRVQSVFDGSYDLVKWSPTIEYVNTGNANLKDVNGRDEYRYQSAGDFIHANREIELTAPYQGTLRLAGKLNKTKATTDDIRLKITLIKRVLNADHSVQSSTQEVVVNKKLAWDWVGNLNLAEDIQVERYDGLVAQIVVDSPVDLTALKWGDLDSPGTARLNLPKLYYTQAWQEQETPTVPDGDDIVVPDTQDDVPTNGDTLKPGPNNPLPDMQPVKDENGNDVVFAARQLTNAELYAPDGRPLMVMPLKYDADVYPQNHLNAPQQSWIAPRDGMVMVTPWVEIKRYSVYDPETRKTIEQPKNISGDINFTVKRRLEHAGKQRVVVASGQVQKTSQGYHGLKLIKVKKGEEIFFDFSMRDPKLEAEVQSAVARAHYASDTPWRVPLTDTVHYLANAATNIALNSDSENVQHTEAMLVIRRGQTEIVHSEIVDFSKGELSLDIAQNVTEGEDWYFDLFTIDSTLNIVTRDAWARYQADSQWIVPTTGQINVFPVLNFKPGASVPDGHVILLVSDGGVPLAERSYAVNNGVVTGGEPFALSVTKDHVLKFAYVTHDHALSSQLADKGSVRLDYLDSLPWQVPTNLANGKIDIDPQIKIAGQVGDGSIDFRVLRGTTVVATRAYTVTGGVISGETGGIPVSTSAGETLNFEYRTRQPDIAAAIKGSKVGVTFNTVGSATSTTDLAPFSVNLFDQLIGSNTFHILMPHKFAVQGQQQAGRHFPLDDDLWGDSYRGWGTAAYNGNGARAGQAISRATFKLSDNPDNYKQSDFEHMAWVSYAAVELDRWNSLDDNWWTGPDEASSSRKGRDFIFIPKAEDYAQPAFGPNSYSGASRPARMSEAVTVNFGLGYVLQRSRSINMSKSRMDVMDMNGDRFPDIVGESGTQYTWADGSLYDYVGGIGRARESTDQNDTLGLGPGGPGAKQNSKSEISSFGDKVLAELASFPISGSISNGENNNTTDLIDMNGDGLPDRVSPGGAGLQVALNNGYGFGSAETWTNGTIHKGKSESWSAGGTVGFSMWNGTLAGGVTLSEAHNYGKAGLLDINGDGLPDAVLAGSNGNLTVWFNNGTGFNDSVTWPNGLQAYNKLREGRSSSRKSLTPLSDGASTSASGSVKYSFGFNIWFINLSFSAGSNYGETVSQPSISYQDVNGDGLIDGIRTADSDHLDVALNPIQRTNMLKQVRRPLGAHFDIDYERTGNTYEQPQSKWVMTDVRVFDGVANDTPSKYLEKGSDWQRHSYVYENGNYDRFEREFLGYQTVTSTQHDTAGKNGANLTANDLTNTPVFRKTVQEYSNSHAYDKGLLLKETLLDASGKPYVATVNKYEFWRVGDSLGSTVEPLDLGRYTTRASATLFPRLTRTEKSFYEGQSEAGQSSYTEHGYDALGNVTDFAEGGSGVDTVSAKIAYSQCDASYIVGKPEDISVSANGIEMRRRTGHFDCGTGNLAWQQAYVDATKAAKTTFLWNDLGNLVYLTGPADNGNGIELIYTYDTETNTYPTEIYNKSYEIRSTASYVSKEDGPVGLFFGKPLSTFDTNGQEIRYHYDSNGRTEWVRGPQESANNQPWTIHFAYMPYVLLDQAPVASYALTRHADRSVNSSGQVSYKTDTIDTVLFTDGSKRVLQTKKDASVSAGNGTAAQDMMIISGRVAVDALGRAIAQYYPTASTKGGSDLTFLKTEDDSAKPTVTDYDLLDRAKSTTLPDGTTTTMDYGFGKDAAGQQRFQTIVTDANGNTKQSFRDVRELITSVVEENRPFDNSGKAVSLGKVKIATQYVYDPLKQITQVIDYKGDITNVAYDKLGRRTMIDNPDTGKTETEYDLASNPIRKITANLRKTGQTIQYDYEFSRLIAIRHPLYPDTDVTYTYGTASDSTLNQAGRVKFVKHQSGTETREYGSLGEVVKETIILTAAANGGSNPPGYTTQYDFDSFGRLHKLMMPDGEIITNHYDSGGNLNAVDGTLNGRPYKYLERLDYDRFESRVYLKVGNGVETSYRYDPNNRRLANLKAGSPGKSAMQDMTYGYDAVGNIKSLIDDAPIPKTNEYGGKLSQTFDYDDLYRLVKADGEYTTAREVQNYKFAMAYDAIHNITHKTQLHTVSKIGGTPRTEAATTYDWAYTYKDKGQTQPHAPTHIGERSFDYDANGNQSGWQNDTNGSRRTIVWDEENRIREVQDPKHGASFTYNDQGERKLKKSKYGETAYINQFFTVRNGAIASTHVYAGTSRIVTKVGAGTPVDKSTPPDLNGTGNLSLTAPTGGDIVVSDTFTVGTTGTTTATTTSNTPSPLAGEGRGEGASKTTAATTTTSSFPGQGIAHRSDRANEVARNTEKNKHLNGGNPGGDSGSGNSNAGGNGNAAGTSNNPGSNGGNTGGGNSGGSNAGGNGGGNGTGGNTDGGGGAGQGNGREFIFFYHPDHLGSTGYVTDEKALRYEHITYFPFGETWVQESNATWRVPYQFTSKEMDQETGLYYFGARYYDPRTSVWASADPILGTYLNGRPNGGVHNSVNLALYTYSFNNPVRYLDPDGNAGRDPSSLSSALLDTGKGVLNSGVGLVEGVPNLLTGAIPGGPDYVPFLDGLRMEYDTPAFGMTIEVLTGVGALKILGEMGAASKVTPKAGTGGTSGELSTSSGKIHGNSTGSSATGGDPRAPMHPETQQALDSVKKPSRSHGHCCEIDAINKAKNAGIDVRGAKMGPARSNETGNIIPPCSTCREVKKTLGVE